MEYRQDWLTRQIQQVIQALCRVLLGKDAQALAQEESPKWEALRETLEQEGIGKAEDRLVEGLESGEPGWTEAGLRFYGWINGLSDEALERENFPREEIREGLERLSGMELLL